MEAAQVPINRGMDKEDVVYIYNGILLSHKKEQILPFAIKMVDLEGIMFNEINQGERKWFI